MKLERAKKMEKRSFVSAAAKILRKNFEFHPSIKGGV